MHYCLQVPELVSNIFQYCRANDEAVYRRSPRLKSLPALAQTCQFFLAPALDAHWHTIPSLEPLLNLLPQDVVELRTGRYSSKPLLYVKPSIQRRDFSRWMYYSPRVKAIDTSYYALPFSILEIDNSVYDVLLSVSDSGDPLLPNIQDITTGIRFIHTSLTLLNLLFNQHVRRIMVIDSSDDEADFDDELPWAELAAIIKHRNVGEGVIDVTINLRFFAENTSIHSPRPLTQQILNYSRLRKLDLRSFWLPDAAMVAQIGLLPLEELQINLERFSDLPSLPPPDDRRQGYFHGLKHATTFVRSPDALLDLIEQWHATKLQSLTIDRPHRSFVWNLEDIFKFLAEHLSSATLQSLVFRTVPPNTLNVPYNQNTSDISSKTLSLLFPLKNLVELNINVGGRVSLKDTDLVAIASAWPLLENFGLYERVFSVSSDISPRGVLSFVAALPRLRDLTLRFNALSHSLSIEGIHTLRHLLWLNVCTSDADNPDMIAQFIRQAFPSLKGIEFGWDYIDGDPIVATGNYYANPQEARRGKESHECWKQVLVALEPFEGILLL